MRMRFLAGAVFALLTAGPAPQAPPGPDTLGQWSGVMNLPVVPIHSHLLPTGKVLFWDRHISSGQAGQEEINPRLWDPVADPGMTATVKTNHPMLELFCEMPAPQIRWLRIGAVEQLAVIFKPRLAAAGADRLEAFAIGEIEP